MSSPSDPAAKAAAEDAAEEAFHKSMVEIWTLFSIAVCVTLVRTYARVKAVGFRDLRPDDYLVWVGVVRPVILSFSHYTCTTVVHRL